MRIAGFLLVCAIVGRSQEVACDCSYVPTCQRVEHTAVIFLGRVISAGPEQKGPFQFEVEESFKGLGLDKRKVDLVRGLCPWPFKAGERYLVLAQRSQDVLMSSSCSGSRSAWDASDDIDYMRKWAGGDRPMILQGRVAANTSDSLVSHELDYNHKPALGGVEVLATQRAKQFRGVTDSKGAFRIEVQEAGSYDVRVTMSAFESAVKPPVHRA